MASLCTCHLAREQHPTGAWPAGHRRRCSLAWGGGQHPVYRWLCWCRRAGHPPVVLCASRPATQAAGAAGQCGLQRPGRRAALHRALQGYARLRKARGPAARAAPRRRAGLPLPAAPGRLCAVRAEPAGVPCLPAPFRPVLSSQAGAVQKGCCLALLSWMLGPAALVACGGLGIANAIPQQLSIKTKAGSADPSPDLAAHR